MTISSATFVGVPPGCDFGRGLVSDGTGSIVVATGVAGGNNSGAQVLLAVRSGGISLPPQTAGYLTAKAAAVAAIAAVSASPTQAQIQSALTAVLAAVNGLTAE
jgi:hypothetical protein